MIICKVEDSKGRSRTFEDVDALEFQESSSTFIVRMGMGTKAELLGSALPLKITVTAKE